ncbi:hypothetical protein ACE193_24905 [Bernardetia sp. OM2101]|uniref:hypothetical protein n=1 Tax=Bernardetia sp. OM2101 TaxID=3344876 RepID=UPI0035D0787C
MKKYISAFLITIFMLCIVACTSEQEQQPTNLITENLSESQIDSVLNQFEFEYENPVFIENSDEILLPIKTSLVGNGKSSRKYSGYSYDSYDSYEEKNRFTTTWNMLFYNKATGNTHLLTDQKYNITDFTTNIKETGAVLSKSILYNIISLDNNYDGELDYKDPQNLYISTNDGKNLKLLSPQKEALQSYTLVPKNDQIIIRTLRDTNNDSLFRIKEDEQIWYKIDLQTDSVAKEMVEKNLQEKVKRLYFEQWLKKK